MQRRLTIEEQSQLFLDAIISGTITFRQINGFLSTRKIADTTFEIVRDTLAPLLGLDPKASLEQMLGALQMYPMPLITIGQATLPQPVLTSQPQVTAPAKKEIKAEVKEKEDKVKDKDEEEKAEAKKAEDAEKIYLKRLLYFIGVNKFRQAGELLDEGYLSDENEQTLFEAIMGKLAQPEFQDNAYLINLKNAIEVARKEEAEKAAKEKAEKEKTEAAQMFFVELKDNVSKNEFKTVYEKLDRSEDLSYDNACALLKLILPKQIDLAGEIKETNKEYLQKLIRDLHAIINDPEEYKSEKAADAAQKAEDAAKEKAEREAIKAAEQKERAADERKRHEESRQAELAPKSNLTDDPVVELHLKRIENGEFKTVFVELKDAVSQLSVLDRMMLETVLQTPANLSKDDPEGFRKKLMDLFDDKDLKKAPARGEAKKFGANMKIPKAKTDKAADEFELTELPLKRSSASPAKDFDRTADPIPTPAGTDVPAGYSLGNWDPKNLELKKPFEFPLSATAPENSISPQIPAAIRLTMNELSSGPALFGKPTGWDGVSALPSATKSKEETGKESKRVQQEKTIGDGHEVKTTQPTLKPVALSPTANEDIIGLLFGERGKVKDFILINSEALSTDTLQLVRETVTPDLKFPGRIEILSTVGNALAQRVSKSTPSAPKPPVKKVTDEVATASAKHATKLPLPSSATSMSAQDFAQLIISGHGVQVSVGSPPTALSELKRQRDAERAGSTIGVVQSLGLPRAQVSNPISTPAHTVMSSRGSLPDLPPVPDYETTNEENDELQQAIALSMAGMSRPGNN